MAIILKLIIGVMKLRWKTSFGSLQVSKTSFIQMYVFSSFLGRMEPSVPRSKRLLTDERSNIFVYMTGHGGNEFLKFQDNEEISAFDLADAFEQMYQKKRYVFFLIGYSPRILFYFIFGFLMTCFRYNEIFFMIDTCQANTMYSKLYSPNIFAVGSSALGESSYSVSDSPQYDKAILIQTYMYMNRSMKTTTILEWL